MNIFVKIKWVVAILGIFLIILSTNLIDKNNFLRIEESIENIYNERLLSKELLMDISIQFHDKEIAYALNDSVYLQSKNSEINDKIAHSLKQFDRVELTTNEKYILKDLNRNHKKLIQLESNVETVKSLYNPECASIFSAINKNIVDLASEQIQEGKNQKKIANDAVSLTKLFSKIEIYILIFLAIILQVIILYTPKK